MFGAQLSHTNYAYFIPDNSSDGVSIQNNNLQYFSSGTSANWKGTATIQYTKTTDQATN